jgi:hypothetical protein
MTDGSKDRVLRAVETVRREVEDLSKRNDEAWALIAKYQKVLDQCPGGFPDGTGFLSPENWIQWAKKQLGYGE